jgi:hypothetical protein
VNDCIVKFVVVTDAPRLTGFELADAAVAACESKVVALRAVLDDQGFDPPQSKPYVDQTIAAAKQRALAALAASDRAHPVKPSDSHL